MSQRNIIENVPVRNTRLRASTVLSSTVENIPSTSRAPSARSVRESNKEKENLILRELTELINDPNVSGPKMDIFLSKHLNRSNRKKLLDIELWKSVLQKWMTTNMWGPFYYIVNKRYADTDSSPWFVWIITFMAQNEIYEMFDKTMYIKHPLWSQIKKDVAEENYKWWNEPLIKISLKQNNMSTNEIEFFKRLYTNSWFVPFDAYFNIHSDLHPYAALRFLEKNKDYALLDSDEFNNLISSKNKSEPINLIITIINYYVENKRSPPITFTQDTTDGFTNIIQEKSKLFTFLEYCVKSKSKELLMAVTKLVNMTTDDNKNGLSKYIYIYIIRKYNIETIMGDRNMPVIDSNIIMLKLNVISFILKNYNINANDLYVNIDSYNQLRNILHYTSFAVIMKMKPLFSKFPILLLAVLFNCHQLVRLLITYGNASTKRCAFSIFDLTTDTETIKALNIKKTLKNVTRRYREESLKPDNPVGRSRRLETWSKHIKEQEDLKNSGGSKKKIQKPKSGLKKDLK